MCPLLCLKLFMMRSHLNKIDIKPSGFCTGTDFKMLPFFRGLKSLASHLCEIYRCFLRKTSTPVKVLRLSSPTVHRLHKHRMSVWFCGAARLFSSSGPDSSDYRDLPLPAFIPVELWNMDLAAVSLALCVVFVFIFIKTSLYIIYLVLEHGKHLGQLQSLLNVLWNNHEYERELQTAHISFKMSAVWIYTLSVRKCKATNVEPFERPFFWLQSCRCLVLMPASRKSRHSTAADLSLAHWFLGKLSFLNSFPF